MKCTLMKCFEFPYLGDVNHVQLFKDENGAPRGCGLITFASEDLAKKAVDVMHNFEHKSKYYLLKIIMFEIETVHLNFIQKLIIIFSSESMLIKGTLLYRGIELETYFSNLK